MSSLLPPIQFTVGDNTAPYPITDGSNCWDCSVLKYKAYTFEINGVGYLFEDSDYSRKSGGGIQLNNGNIFSSGQKITVSQYLIGECI